MNNILQGPAQEQLKSLESDSIDLIVTDPPYGYSFMNKDWDKAVVGVDTWKECVRVLKAGAFAFIMSSPRQDVLCKMILNLIDAGFETNFTSLYWCYASGFPKAADVSKLTDKRNGKHRPVRSIELEEYLKSKIKERYSNHRELAKEMGIDESCIRRWTGKHLDYSIAAFIPPENKYEILKQKLGLDDRFDELIEREEAEREIIEQKTKARSEGGNFAMPTMGAQTKYIDIDYTIPATEQAKKLEGAYAGFQPKPAVEVILTVMKPLSEKTFVDQALSNGKGVTWLSDVKVPVSSEDDNVFDALVQAYDSIQDVLSPTIWYNNSYKDLYHHVHDSDGILGKELRLLVPYGKPLNHQSSNDVLHVSSLYESLGSLNDCPVCYRLCDGLVRSLTTCARDAFPLLNDVLGYIHQFVLEHKHIQKSQYNDHLSNVRALLRILGVLVSGDSLAYYNNPRDNNKRFPANLIVSDNTLSEFSRYFSLDSWTEKTLPFLITPKPSKAEKGPNNSHPTVKSRKLMSYLITMGSREGDVVLDPFCGSGTVLIAAHELHRKWIGIELNPDYVEIANQRLRPHKEQTRLL